MAFLNNTSRLTLGVFFITAFGAYSPLSIAVESSLDIKPARPVSSVEANTAMSATEKLLMHLATARGAMDKGNSDEARTHLIEARAMLDRVRSQRPPAQVSYNLSSKKISAISYQDIVKNLAPGEESKLQKAAEAIRKGDLQDAAMKLDEVGTGIAFVQVNYVVDNVDAFVTQAIKSLEGGSSDDADKALRQARSSIDVTSGAMAKEPPIKKK